MMSDTRHKLTICHNIIIIGGGARCDVLLPLLVKQPNSKIVAVVETNSSSHPKLRAILDQCGASSAILTSSLDSLLEKQPISSTDVAFILTPEWTHVNIFSSLVKTDCHIFIEKPLATTAEEVVRIKQLADKTNGIIQVGFVLRYTSFYKAIKDTVTNGLIGELIMIEMCERLSPLSGSSNRRRWHRLIKNSGGFLNEKSSHDLDIMCWLKEHEAKPAYLFSHGGQNFFNKNGMPKNCKECNDLDCVYRFKGNVEQSSYNAVGKIPPDTCVYNSDADIMDNQSVTISFSDGTQGIFTLLNVSGAEGREIRIHGTEGMLTGNTRTKELSVLKYRENKELALPLPDDDSGHYGGDAIIIETFFQQIENADNSSTSIADGVQASLLAFAADQSVKTKSVIDFNKFYSNAMSLEV